MKRVFWLLLLCLTPITIHAQGAGTAASIYRTTFANLGAPANGSVRYVTDGTPNTSPCTGGGSGAFAERTNGVWVCGGAVAGVPATRNINTTTPLTGGGDLSADRTLACATCEVTGNKDATGGYAGLTLFKINFRNAANTFTSFFTNANSAARTYTFQNRDGTIADDTDLALKAPLASPALTGNPTAPTQSQSDNSTKIATTAYVDTLGATKQATITFGTGVQTALGVNIGSAGAPVLFNGAGGTPSSMVGTNITGTAASLTAGAVTGFTAGAGVLTGPASAGVAMTLGNTETVAGVKTFTAANKFLNANTYFGSTQGYVYTNEDEINGRYDANSQVPLLINNRGYLAGLTQFRDLQIGDGKGAAVSYFNGSTKVITLNTTAYNTCTALTTSAGVLTCTVSDERAKHDIAAFRGQGMETIRRIQPITFQFNKGTVWFKGRTELGLSAQNLRVANPLLASYTGNKDNLLQPEPLALHAIEIDAIKSLDARLTKLEKENTRLRRLLHRRAH
jgi:Chaperone of endosialidase